MPLTTNNTDRSDVLEGLFEHGTKKIGKSTEVIAAVGDSNLSKRQRLLIYADENNSDVVYWGKTGVVSTTTGIPLRPGMAVDMPLGADISIYLIGGANNQNVIIMEFA